MITLKVHICSGDEEPHSIKPFHKPSTLPRFQKGIRVKQRTCSVSELTTFETRPSLTEHGFCFFLSTIHPTMHLMPNGQELKPLRLCNSVTWPFHITVQTIKLPPALPLNYQRTFQPFNCPTNQPIEPYQSYLQTPMATFTPIQICKFWDPKEESISDLDVEIYETVLTLGNLIKIKNKLTLVPNFNLDTFCASLFEITIDPFLTLFTRSWKIMWNPVSSF